MEKTVNPPAMKLGQVTEQNQMLGDSLEDLRKTIDSFADKLLLVLREPETESNNVVAADAPLVGLAYSLQQHWKNIDRLKQTIYDLMDRLEL